MKSLLSRSLHHPIRGSAINRCLLATNWCWVHGVPHTWLWQRPPSTVTVEWAIAREHLHRRYRTLCQSFIPSGEERPWISRGSQSSTRMKTRSWLLKRTQWSLISQETAPNNWTRCPLKNELQGCSASRWVIPPWKRVSLLINNQSTPLAKIKSPSTYTNDSL